MSDQPILIERHEPVRIVTINRPKVLNAIDVPTFASWKDVSRSSPTITRCMSSW
jgi:enoyl-CoA hydratase/carnithine racemase